MIKVGICSYGLSGQVFHVPFLIENPGFEVTAVVERSKDEVRKRYDGIKIYRSVEELYLDTDIDLIVVNTPVNTHYEYAKEALTHGKHVIVEKPFTVTAREAIDLVEIARSAGRMLSVFQNRRFDRDFIQVQHIIDSHVLGDIKEAEIRWDRYRPLPSGKAHKEDAVYAGAGILHDLGAHLIDQALLLFGVPQQVFADVFSMKGKEFANDYFEILFFYSSGLRVRLKTSSFSMEESYAYKIHGTSGSFLQERSDSQEDDLRAGGVPKYGTEWTAGRTSPDGILHYIDGDQQEHRKYIVSHYGTYANYFDNIYQAIRGKENVPSPGEEVVLRMTIIEKCLDSATRGYVVTV